MALPNYCPYHGYADLPFNGTILRGTAGHWRTGKMNGNRLVMVCPDGHVFPWLMVWHVVGDQGSLDHFGQTQTAYLIQKYGTFGNNLAWGTAQAQRLHAWGFTGVQAYSNPNANAFINVGNPAGSHPLPFLYILQPNFYATYNQAGYANAPIKNIIRTNGNYYAYWDTNQQFPDVADPNYRQYLHGMLPGEVPWIIGAQYLLGLTIDDTDHMRGFGAGPAFTTQTIPGLNQAHLGFICAIGKPYYTSGWSFLVNDVTTVGFDIFPGRPATGQYVHCGNGYANNPWNYSKLMLRDFLIAKYGTIANLNNAWGSTYTTFDMQDMVTFASWNEGSTGATGTGFLDENGKNPWMGNGQFFTNVQAGTLTALSAVVKADLDAFLLFYASFYFKMCHDELKAFSPDTLYGGIGDLSTWDAPTFAQVLQAAGANCDFVHGSYGAFGYPDSAQRTAYMLANLGEVPFASWVGGGSPDSAQGGGGMASTQAGRGTVYQNLLHGLLTTTSPSGTFINIGTSWWAMYDDYQEGVNWGLATYKDNAYDGVEARSAPGVDSNGFTRIPEAPDPTRSGDTGNYGDMISGVKAAHAQAFLTYQAQAGPPVIPVASFSWTQRAGTLTVDFFDTSTGPPTAWAWDFGDGSTSTQQSPTHTFAGVGPFTVRLTASNTLGSNQGSQAVTLTAVVAGVFAFIRNAINITNFNTGLTQTCTPTAIDVGDVVLVWVDAQATAGCDVTSVTDSLGNVYTAALPTLAWDAGGAVMRLFYTIATVGGTSPTVTAHFSLALTGQCAIDVYEAAVSQTATVSLVAAVSNSAVAGASPMSAGPIVVNQPKNLLVAFNDRRQTPATPPVPWTVREVAHNLVWDNLNQPAGTYPVTGTFAAGTQNWALLAVALQAAVGTPAPPTADFIWTVTGLSAAFHDQSLGAPTSWSWIFGDGSAVSTLQNPTHVYAAPGTYTVQLTATNAGGSTTTSKTVAIATPINLAPAVTPMTGQALAISAVGSRTPPAFVQQQTGPGGTTSDAATFAGSTPLGNLILVFLLFDAAVAFTSVADDLGNTYTQIGSEQLHGGTTTRAYWAKNATAGVRTVTVTVGAGSTFCTVHLVEYTQQDVTTPLDSFAFAFATAAANPTDADLTIADQTMLVAWGQHTRPGVGTVTTAGFTVRLSTGGLALYDKVITPPANTTVTFHEPTNGADWQMWLVGIRGLGAVHFNLDPAATPMNGQALAVSSQTQGVLAPAATPMTGQALTVNAKAQVALTPASTPWTGAFLSAPTRLQLDPAVTPWRGQGFTTVQNGAYTVIFRRRR